MHTFKLQGIRIRVDRLAARVRASGCDGNHSLVKVSDVHGDELAPRWPPDDAPERCVCGAELQYCHVVNHFGEVGEIRRTDPAKSKPGSSLVSR
jgi:hypothetical protein